jgi:hypothetical protein
MRKSRVVLVLVLLALAACAVESRRSRRLKASAKSRGTDFDFFFLVRCGSEVPQTERADLKQNWLVTDFFCLSLLSGSGLLHSAMTTSAHTAHPNSKSHERVSLVLTVPNQ